MRKNFLLTILGIALIVLLFCSCVPRTYASDLPEIPEETTTETTDEQPVEENEEEKPQEEVQEVEQEKKVSFGEMFKSFLDKFLPSVFGGISSGATLLFIYLFYRKSIKKMAYEVINSSVLSKEEKDASLKVLNKANETIDKVIDEMKDKVEDFEEINKKAEEKFDKLEQKANEVIDKLGVSEELVTKLFSIVAIVVSQNPNLCNEGYAKELLELMETSKKEGE